MMNFIIENAVQYRLTVKCLEKKNLHRTSWKENKSKKLLQLYY